MSDLLIPRYINRICSIAAKVKVQRIGIPKEIFDRWRYTMKMQDRHADWNCKIQNLIHCRTGIIVLRGLASERKKDAQQHNALQ